jgi:hypothetical protein
MTCPTRAALKCGVDEKCRDYLLRLGVNLEVHVYVDSLVAGPHYKGVAKAIRGIERQEEFDQEYRLIAPAALGIDAKSGKEHRFVKLLAQTTAHAIAGASAKLPRLRRVRYENLLQFCQIAGICIEEVICTPPPPPPAPPPFALLISRPTHDAVVGPFSDVAGTIRGNVEDNEGSLVWVLIRPDQSWWWVQRPATISENRWRAVTFFGDPGTEDGWKFEVGAVIDPELQLRENLKLREIPKARLASNRIHVRFKWSRDPQ